jgi:hypothetical protein
MDINELKVHLSKISQDGWENFHYFSSPNNQKIIQTTKQWLNQVNRNITTSHSIDQSTEDAVNASLRMFEKFWQIIGVIETISLKKYVFACYSIIMKYMYDYIDTNVMFRNLGYKFANADIVSAEFKILDLLEWKIEF